MYWSNLYSWEKGKLLYFFFGFVHGISFFFLSRSLIGKMLCIGRILILEKRVKFCTFSFNWFYTWYIYFFLEVTFLRSISEDYPAAILWHAFYVSRKSCSDSSYGCFCHLEFPLGISKSNSKSTLSLNWPEFKKTCGIYTDNAMAT